MYPIDAHGPKPADITTTNAFNTFSPLSLSIFLASFENLSPLAFPLPTIRCGAFPSVVL